MSPEEQKYAINLAKDALKEYLESEKEIAINETELIESFGSDSEFLAHQGCFVTLKKDGDLRGCIGTIVSDEPLYKNIISNAINAGTRDPRFPQVGLDEYELLSFEISVMGPLTPVTDVSTIEVGKHGLIMKQGFYQGLLLPQVPIEWNWDRETFLRQTCLKAGLNPDAWKDKATSIFSFTAEVFGEV